MRAPGQTLLGIAVLVAVTGLTLPPPGQAADRMGHKELAQQIDRFLDQKLKEEGATVSPQASDAEFMRRAYLDLTGKIPTADEAVRFLDSNDPEKRAKLIDELLDNPGFGAHLADIWQTLMLPITSETRRVRSLFPEMHKWLADGFNKNRPWNEMVRDLITVTGAPQDNGSVVFYLANPTPDKLTDQVSKLFLGVQLQCAQCHDHPFTDWKQTEYWGVAAFFTKVSFSGNPRQAQRGGTTVKLTESGKGRRIRLPQGAKIVPPKYLQGEQPELSKNEPYRPALAEWMTSKKNPYFARAMVNRIWAQLFGRGIVDPVDDMHEGRLPSHPELLATLTEQFKASDFKVKDLFRAICNSEAYQRTSKPEGDNQDVHAKWLARMPIKVLTAEQLYDSLNTALPAPAQAKGRNRNNRRGATSARDVFVAFFAGEEEIRDPTEYQAGIPQALRLMNAPQYNSTLQRHPAIQKGLEPAKTIEQLYLSTVSRRPSAEEKDRLLAYVQKQDNPRTAYTDILWALINSSEFTTSH
jgi:hypothetical protein